jgi:hypothetical protein
VTRGAFVASAVLAAGAFAGATAWLFPYRALRLDSPELRWNAWLLTLWTAGVLALCFGAAGLRGPGTPLGGRDVAHAGSLGDALRERHLSRSARAGANFATWLLAVGAALVAIYFAAWTVGRGG